MRARHFYVILCDVIICPAQYSHDLHRPLVADILCEATWRK